MMGPPGSGKTMLASRLPSILAPLSRSEALEAAVIHSVAGRDAAPLLAGISRFMRLIIALLWRVWWAGIASATRCHLASA